MTDNGEDQPFKWASVDDLVDAILNDSAPYDMDDCWSLVKEGLVREHEGIEMSEDFREALGGCGYLLVGLALGKRGISMDTIEQMFDREHSFRFTYTGEDEHYGIEVLFGDEQPMLVEAPR